MLPSSVPPYFSHLAPLSQSHVVTGGGVCDTAWQEYREQSTENRVQSTEYRVQRTALRGVLALTSLLFSKLSKLPKLLNLPNLPNRQTPLEAGPEHYNLPTLFDLVTKSHVTGGGVCDKCDTMWQAGRYLAPRCSLKIPILLGKLTFFSYLCTIMRA